MMENQRLKRSPPWTPVCFLVSGFFCAILWGSAAVAAPAEITRIKLTADGKALEITLRGDPGKVQSRVMSGPNRLVLDFSEAILRKAPDRIEGVNAGIQAIRAANQKKGARIVADFADTPVPSHSVRKDKNHVIVLLGSESVENGPTADSRAATTGGVNEAPPGNIPADSVAVPTSGSGRSSLHEWLDSGTEPVAAQKTGGPTSPPVDPRQIPPGASSKPLTETSVAPWAGPAEANTRKQGDALEKAENDAKTGEKIAQSGQSSQGAEPYRPPSSLPMRHIQPADKPEPSRPRPARSASPAGPRPTGGVREIRPPITPPEPDPRLILQELTEMKFIQVGHNSRLLIRGGDHLDYRLNRISQTKLRLDLINAEIPKFHQKPLRTDLFSTSVHSIVPGSQTIFIQLKEPAPYKVEKKKGVLMVDFSPPRFELPAGIKPPGGPATALGPPTTKPAAGLPTAGRSPNLQASEQDSGSDQTAEDCDSSIECLRKRLDESKLERTKKKKFTEEPGSEILDKKVTMDFQDIKLKNAFRLLSEISAMNISLDPEVDGKTTLRLQNVPVNDAINTIMVTNGLARVMMGDVMRIGKAEKIAEFIQRNQASIDELEQKISATSNRIKSLEARKRQQDNPSPVEGSTRSEEIGEAGCIRFKGEEICFYYAWVKVTYAAPKNIVRTLDCMFNSNCPGTGQGSLGANQEAGSVADQTEKRDQRLEQETQRLQNQGFSPDSVGATDRLASFERLDLDRQVADATTSRLGAARSRGSLSSKSLLDRDPRAWEIISNTTLWPDDVNRMIFIKSTSERISQMKKVIRTLDVPTPQVLIESRIVRASRDWARGLGIKWGGRNNQNGQIDNNKKAFWGITGHQGDTAVNNANTATGQLTAGNDIPSRFAVNLPVPLTTTLLSNIMGLGMQFGLLGTQYITELDLRLQLGETTGQAKTIARPKVQVINGEEAFIRDGEDIPYATTSVQSGTQTQMIPAYLELKVKPKIYTDGRISMNLHVKDDSMSPRFIQTTSNTSQPPIQRREARTIMIVRDGETAVIGGIVRQRDLDRREGWPGLMNLPLIGALFTNKGRERESAELLVFITPTIVKRPPPAS